MKRIEFIAPVEAMRGNLSGAQKLQYPTDNQGAYEAPAGSVNYARNYSPRFVGAKRAKDGRKYFTVRTKTANHLTAKSKKAMALMGGTGAMVGNILAYKSSQLYTSLYAMYLKIQELGDKRSFRQWLSNYVMQGLVAKSATILITGPLSPISIDNPWNTTSETPNVQVSQAVLVKFWSELALNPIDFTIGELKAIAHNNDDFGEIIGSNYNVLGMVLDTTTISGKSYVKLGGSWVMKRDLLDPSAEPEYAETNSVIYPTDEEYTLSAVAPVV